MTRAHANRSRCSLVPCPDCGQPTEQANTWVTDRGMIVRRRLCRCGATIETRERVMRILRGDCWQNVTSLRRAVA